MKSATRQLQLFPTTGFFAARLGADFFDAVPTSPGVYFFYGDEDRLLYIGQSKNLRKRMGSYRFVNVEKHSRRIVRMVHHIRRAEWRLCETGPAAVLLEKELLLEHRPPFNRAGVWVPPPWWLILEDTGDSMSFSLVRTQPEDSGGDVLGPLASGFRYVLGALLRLLQRWLHPEAPLWEYPLGMLQEIPRLTMRLALPAKFVAVTTEVRVLILGRLTDLPMQWEREIELMPESPEKDFWNEQLKQLTVWRDRVMKL